jgi:PIN like domain
MNFFCDRCMPIRIARMVDAYESIHTVRHLDDDERFHRKSPDEEWIATIGNDDPKWIALSGDGRILKNKVMRTVVQKAGITFFCMASPWCNMPAPEYAWKFMRVWPQIVEAAQHSRAPLFEVAGGQAVKVRPMSLTY